MNIVIELLEFQSMGYQVSDVYRDESIYTRLIHIHRNLCHYLSKSHDSEILLKSNNRRPLSYLKL